jgi:hypothetical protein
MEGTVVVFGLTKFSLLIPRGHLSADQEVYLYTPVSALLRGKGMGWVGKAADHIYYTLFIIDCLSEKE